jgi:hypothetical protein
MADVTYGLESSDIKPAITVAPGQPVSGENTSEPSLGIVDKLLSGSRYKVWQKVNGWEALTAGACEMSNVYKIYNLDLTPEPNIKTTPPVLIAKERSDGCDRCCCAPCNSLHIEFMEYEGGPVLFTFERVGSNGLKCTKCVGCCSCGEKCRDEMRVHLGRPQGMVGSWANTETPHYFGAVKEMKNGGGFAPRQQVMDRHAGATEANPSAESIGPTVFGGCCDICTESTFYLNAGTKGAQGRQVAMIQKLKPSGCVECCAEMFTDADRYIITFDQSAGTRQRMLYLANLFLVEFMFFEIDDPIIRCKDGGIHISLCFCHFIGCVCPCKLILKG